MDDRNQYGTLQVQRQLVELLKRFDSLCVKHGINYSLSSGSLLGAIRHGGFIPWDDDVDVTVKRKDFETLVSAIGNDPDVGLSKILWLDRFRFSSDAGRDSAPTIDVFIWDNVPDSTFSRSLKYFAIVMAQGLFKGRPSPRIPLLKRMVMWPFSLIGRVIPENRKIKLYEKVSVMGNGRRTRFCGGYHDQFNALKFKYPASMMDSLERRMFEDIEVSVMADWDGYLKIVFGPDYMVPTPEAQRRPRHIH